MSEKLVQIDTENTVSTESDKTLWLRIPNEEGMAFIGRCFAQTGTEDLTVFLNGELGMGKTTLSRGIIRGYGHTGSVKSPTYTLVEPYEVGSQQIYHFDLYRLADPEELEYLGIRDYFSQPAIRLIEWSEKGRGLLPVADLDINIEMDGKGRKAQFVAHSEEGLKTMETIKNLVSQSEKALDAR